MTEKIHVYMGGRGGGKQNPEVMKALRQWARDAGFNEANVKRDEGGKFSAQQHQAAAQQHSATAAKHPDKQVAKAHADAAQAHTLAAQHIAAQTGWQEHNAQKAHNATKAAEQAEASAGGAANAEQLKAVAADPTKPLAARAEAVKQLEAMQAQADAVAASPLAVPQPKPAAAAPLQVTPAKRRSLAEVAKSLMDRGIIKPGSTTPKPGTAPKLSSTGLQSSKSDVVNSQKPLNISPAMKAKLAAKVVPAAAPVTPSEEGFEGFKLDPPNPAEAAKSMAQVKRMHQMHGSKPSPKIAVTPATLAKLRAKMGAQK